MIPKHIYQTWKTKELPLNIQNVRRKIHELNSEYTMHLYDDNDMLEFLNLNYSKNVVDAFNALSVGAAKADLWRYCILYINGGVYLDIDADIKGSLDTLIQSLSSESAVPQAIITREGNPGLFCQWILLFQPWHPFLKLIIEHCVYNILNKTTTNVMYLTGPALFTSVLNYYLNSEFNVYFIEDNIFNSLYGKNIKVYEIDMGKYASYKHQYTDDLYENHVYWQYSENVFI